MDIIIIAGASRHLFAKPAKVGIPTSPSIASGVPPAPRAINPPRHQSFHAINPPTPSILPRHQSPTPSILPRHQSPHAINPSAPSILPYHQ